MKGLVIFHDYEISFCHADKELERYVRERWTYLEKSAGATEESLQMRIKDFPSIFQEFLQPFCTAFNVLVTLKKQMHSITLDEGFLIVFRKFGQSVFIALSSGHGDTEDDLSKKMQVFNSILCFLVGPVKRRISPRDVNEKKKLHNLLRKLLVTYERLYEEDEIFLLEAVEHITFGQLQTAQEVVIKLARESLDASNNGGLTHVQHAMLLVNSKILAICGKTPQILTSDILLLTLFVHCFFIDIHQITEEDEEDYRGGQNAQDTASITTETSQDRAEVFQTPPMSTPGPISREYIEPEDPPFSTPGPEPDPMLFTTPSEEVEAMGSMKEPGNTGRGIGRLRSLFGGLRGARSGDTGYPEEEEVEDNVKFIEQLVFLQPNAATFIPHFLHCLEVYPGIVLVLISEYGLSQLAGTISQILHHLDDIFSSNHRGGQSVFDILEESFRRTNGLVRHEVQATASNALKQSGQRVQNAWGNLKEAGLRRYLISNQAGDKEVNQARLDSSSSDLGRKLVELYEQLFFTPKQREYDTSHVKSKLLRNFSGLRKDYGEFLAVKGTMNIPMTNFSMLYPGMVHFIFIDRSFDEMTTPSVHRLAAEKGFTSGEELKKMIWKMVKRCRRYLSQGYTSQTWLDNHFLYSYYVWVSQHSTSVHNESRRYSSPTVTTTTEGCSPGIIGTHFYRDLAQGQCYVFELYCIHEAAVPVKTASAQCKELASQLWQNTKAAIAPFSLIN